MEEAYVKAATEIQKIEENKIYLDPGSFYKKIYKKKFHDKKKPKSIISTIPVPEVIENLPNPQKIKNLKLKSQYKRDVGLAILSAQNIVASKKFNLVKEGYVETKNDKLKEKKNKLGYEDFFTDKDNPFDKYVLKQNDICAQADVGTQKKLFQLNLRLGPYKCSYSRNGKYLLVTGEKGHISLIDVQNYDTLCELEVDETVRCNTILHNYKLFAVSQKKYMYMYDNTGMEINCIKDILYTYQMEFLPYHFLLVSIGEFGELVYQDISMGTIVTRKKTKRGPCHIMKQNKKNAIIYLGHKNGHVSLWTPNIDKPVCDIFCSYTPISSIGVYDNYLITASIDSTYKLWDIRNLKYINSYKAHNIINNVEISDTSIVAFSMNSHFRAYKNFFTSPELFLRHDTYGSRINTIAFQPFEDICCIAANNSVQTIIIPGAGIATIDSYVNNPYETKKEIREKEVKALLDKLPPETITFKENQLGRLNPYRNKNDKEKTKKKNTDIVTKTNMKQQKKNDDTSTENKTEEKQKTEKKKKGKKTKKIKKNTIRSNIPKYMRKSALDRMKETKKEKQIEANGQE